MKAKTTMYCLLLACLLAPLRLTAEDIDLFVGRSSSPGDAAPSLIREPASASSPSCRGA